MLKKLSVFMLGLMLCVPAFSYVVVNKTVVIRERPVVVRKVVYVHPYRHYYYRHYWYGYPRHVYYRYYY